jgi:hypothetical protein
MDAYSSLSLTFAALHSMLPLRQLSLFDPNAEPGFDSGVGSERLRHSGVDEATSRERMLADALGMQRYACLSWKQCRKMTGGLKFADG